MKLFHISALVLLLAPVAYGAEGERIEMDKDCTVTVPPGAKAKPTPEWYSTFKENFGDAASQANADGMRWKGQDRKQFDACAAFQVLLGIGWKESQLNPKITGDLNQPYHAHGLFQIQQRNCSGGGGVGVNGDLNQPIPSIQCAARIMARNFKKDHCITAGANQAKNGRCLTNWSTMICHATPGASKYGHREDIRGVSAQNNSCQ
jgi:hypothetical protein